MALGASKRLSVDVLRVARVLRSKPHENAYDVIFTDDGSTAYSVQVLSQMAGVNHGTHYLPDPRPKDGGKPKDVDLNLDVAGDRDMLAVVANLMGIPLIIGFKYPEVTHNAFEYDKFPDMRVDRHVSDFETITLADGSYALRHPSGTKIEFGSVPDLTGQDFDKKYAHTRNSKAVQPILISVPSAGGDSLILIDKGGNITVNAAANATVTAKKDVSVTAGGNVAIKGAAKVDVKAAGALSLAGSTVTISASGAVNITGHPLNMNA